MDSHSIQHGGNPKSSTGFLTAQVKVIEAQIQQVESIALTKFELFSLCGRKILMPSNEEPFTYGTGNNPTTLNDIGLNNFALNLCPYMIARDFHILTAHISIAAAAIENNVDVVYPCFLAIGVIRNNFDIDSPIIGDTKRTLLGTLFFQIDDPSVICSGTQVNKFNNLNAPLMSGSGNGCGTYEVINNVDIPLKRGWRIGLVLWKPIDNSGNTESKMDDNNIIIPWTPLGIPVDINSSINAVLNLEINLGLSIILQ